jgi:hypothetical protein
MLILDELDESSYSPLAHYQIIRRNGAVVPFEPNKIADAMMRAFFAVRGYTFRQAQGQLLAVGGLNSCSSWQVEYRHDLVGVGGCIRQHLLSLFKTTNRAAKACVARLNGFFCVSKANLRNAP